MPPTKLFEFLTQVDRDLQREALGVLGEGWRASSWLLVQEVTEEEEEEEEERGKYKVS